MKRNAIAFEDEEDVEEALLALSLEEYFGKNARRSALFRKRWDSEYFINLAVNENSFVAEYRLDVKAFHSLQELLSPRLICNDKMALLRCGKQILVFVATKSISQRLSFYLYNRKMWEWDCNTRVKTWISFDYFIRRKSNGKYENTWPCSNYSVRKFL